MNGGMLFYEVSAKTADNIQTAFESIVRKALEKTPKEDFRIPAAVVDLENKNKKQEGKGCPC
jgi:Ras-related protein Rab-7A